MGTQPIGLRDVAQHGRHSRLRLLAPINYLWIRNPEKAFYDFKLPLWVAGASWLVYMAVTPKPPLFGSDGLLTLAKDLLVMTVPFLIGSLAAVSMASPGEHFDTRPKGVPLYLDNDLLTLRQFMCYLLGYLCFLSMITLLTVIISIALRKTIALWVVNVPGAIETITAIGTLGLSILFSSLLVTFFWSLYFLTHVVNVRK